MRHAGHHAACSRAVSVARDERVRRGAAVPAHGADGAKCPKHPRRSYVHALGRDHRALLGPPGSGRESLGRSRSRYRRRYAAGLLPGCGRRRQTAPDGTSSPGSRLLGPVWVSTCANLGGRLQRPVRAPVRDDGDGRGRRDVGRDRLFYDGSCRAQRVHGANATKFANQYLARCSKSPQTAGSRSETSGWGGKRSWIGRPHGRDEN